jgi:NADH dehydrogenase
VKPTKPHILILGGGYAGVYTALELEKELRRSGDFAVTLISKENFFVFEPMLPEVASGSLDPRHIVNPIRHLLRRTRFCTADVQSIDLEKRRVTVAHGLPRHNHNFEFDYLVVGLGSVTNTSPVPGVGQHARTLKTLSDAIRIRNHVLGLLDDADLEDDRNSRRAQLTFVVAGGGLTGVEAVGEIASLLHDAVKFHPRLSFSELRVLLVEAGPRLLPEMPERLGHYAERKLARDGVEVLLNRSLVAAEGNAVVLDDGTRVPTRTLLWTAGIATNPIVATLPCKKDHKGRLIVNEYLEIPGHENVWALGDNASLINSNTGKPYPPMAQYAMRQAKITARNLIAIFRGKPPTPFTYVGRGQLATVGRRSAVAQIFGVQISGFPAWWLWRTIYLMKLPGLNRKLRVMIDWTLDLIFPRDIVQYRFSRAEPVTRAHFDPKAIISWPGDPADRFYIVERGEVEVVEFGADGRENLLARLGPGEYFGEMAILDEEHERRAVVRSITSVDVVAIPREHFEVMVKESKDLRQSFQRVIDKRHGAISDGNKKHP